MPARLIAHRMAPRESVSCHNTPHYRRTTRWLHHSSLTNCSPFCRTFHSSQARHTVVCPFHRCHASPYNAQGPRHQPAMPCQPCQTSPSDRPPLKYTGQANPPSLHSHIAFIARFRNPDCMRGVHGCYFTHLRAATHFLQVRVAILGRVAA